MYRMWLINLLLLTVVCYVVFVAPVCFNTTYCEGVSVGDSSISFDQCCFELFGTSFASSGRCLLCLKTGN